MLIPTTVTEIDIYSGKGDVQVVASTPGGCYGYCADVTGVSLQFCSFRLSQALPAIVFPSHLCACTAVS